MKALLVIDIQNDFLSQGALAVPHGDEIVQPVIDLIEDPSQQWHRVVMTRDWHPYNHISFAKVHKLPDFSSYTYHSPIENDNSTQEGTLWPVHCVQGTHGAELAAPLIEEQRKIGCHVIDKGYLQDREYYSAFNDIWNYHRTELNNYLHCHHIDEVYVVGLALDFCVKNTAISASKLGYKTTILEKYTRPIYSDEKSMHKLKQELAENNVQLA
ncbi:probable Nicotinamidase [Zygosaccharomyces bailii ISA1307]|nr:probable Nicotinamidase [Zygosaccharomyces bailii ISA1307]